MKDHIIFSGPEKSGKTTAIQTISDVFLLKTDSTYSTDFKYGVLDVGNEEKIYLSEVPSKAPENFMGDHLNKRGLGLILLLDNSRTSPLRDMSYYLNCFADFTISTSLAIGIINMGENNKLSINDYHQAIDAGNLKPAIFSIDAREKKDVSILVSSLLYSLEPGAKL